MVGWAVAAAVIGGSVATSSGKLYLAGGGTTSKEVAQAFIADCGGGESLILVMPQTRVDPPKGISSVEFLKKHGAKNVVLLAQSEPTDKDRADVSEYLKKAKGVWVPGGDQKLFPQRWGIEWLRKEFRLAYDNGVNFFGTSAGSMMMSDPMIGGPGELLDTVELKPGIGLFPGLIDTHFGTRQRNSRFEDGLKKRGTRVGIGLDEEEWVVFQDGVIIKIEGKPLILGIPLKIKDSH